MKEPIPPGRRRPPLRRKGRAIDLSESDIPWRSRRSSSMVRNDSFASEPMRRAASSMTWARSATSEADRALLSASLRTCWATTVNPRPASPARLSSMAAFRDRSSVWSATSPIRATTSSIRDVRSSRRRVASIAFWIISRDLSTTFPPSRAAWRLSVAFLATSLTDLPTPASPRLVSLTICVWPVKDSWTRAKSSATGG